MPRTKQPRKVKRTSSSSDGTDSLIKDFERQVHLKMHSMEVDIDMSIRGLENRVTVALSRIPSDIRKFTLGEMLALNSNDDKENTSQDDRKRFLSPLMSSTVKPKKKVKRATGLSDDGYVTEAGTSHSRVKSVENSKLRSRSSSRSKKPKISFATQKSVSKMSKDCMNQSKLSTSKFKTPATLKQSTCEFDPVTPKIKPNTPMSVLRRPREGEMALSMQGSPLLISSVVQERSANVIVPLDNGDIISLLPRDGLRLSNIPSLDAETVRQLQTLKGHIEKVINLK